MHPSWVDASLYNISSPEKQKACVLHSEYLLCSFFFCHKIGQNNNSQIKEVFLIICQKFKNNQIEYAYNNDKNIWASDRNEKMITAFFPLPRNFQTPFGNISV